MGLKSHRREVPRGRKPRRFHLIRREKWGKLKGGWLGGWRGLVNEKVNEMGF